MVNGIVHNGKIERGYFGSHIGRNESIESSWTEAAEQINKEFWQIIEAENLQKSKNSEIEFQFGQLDEVELVAA